MASSYLPTAENFSDKDHRMPKADKGRDLPLLQIEVVRMGISEIQSQGYAI